MTETFQTAIDTAFALHGVAATYTPPAGSGVSVTVMPAQETDEIDGFGRNGHLANENYFDVRVSEVATPAKTGTLLIDGVTYTIRERQYKDTRQLIWRVMGEPA